ncbi:MAG: tetratricopeptide repeat protein, partial [Planctomycetota bacterium]
MEDILSIDPTYGRVHYYLARTMEDRRRFSEAARWARRGAAVDPVDPLLWFTLGRNLLNEGLEEEAATALDKADAADPWRSIFRKNFRSVLELLDGYTRGSTAHFDLRIHADEDAALRSLYEETLEASYAHFVERYGFEPEGPLVTEVFRRQSDFSARTMGIPGLGAVGACFGRVITLDSPAALPPGGFCWKSTAHHEVAHVFSLQMSRGRVPRWFTEGLAVHEERRWSPAWNRNMDRDLVSALANGKVVGIRELDGSFRGPGIGWAYYQGGLMCDWMEREYGWTKVLEMLRQYGRDKGDVAVIEEVLGVTPEEFDASFLRYCKRKVKDWKVRPFWSDEKLREFRRRSNKDAKDIKAHLYYAEACLQRGRDTDAGTGMARARALADENYNAHLLELRARNALAKNPKSDRGLKLMREALDKGWDHFDLRMVLANAAGADGDEEKAVEHFRMAKQHFPRATGRADPRRALASLYLSLERPDDARRELEEIAAMGETELDARMKLARIYEDAGEKEIAARMLGEILDIRPINGKGEQSFPAVDIHARLGRVLMELNRPIDARKSFRRAVATGRLGDPRVVGEELADLLVEEAQAALSAGLRDE